MKPNRILSFPIALALPVVPESRAAEEERPANVIQLTDEDVANLPPEALEPITLAPEPEHVVPKATAKSSAEQLTRRPCRVKTDGGYCILIVHWEEQDEEFRGASWWLVLRNLFSHLVKRGLVKLPERAG